jgi:hypothetical protein
VCDVPADIAVALLPAGIAVTGTWLCALLLLPSWPYWL